MADNNNENPPLVTDQFIPGDTANYFVVGSWQIALGNSDPNEGPPIPCVAAQIIPLNSAVPIMVIWPEHVLKEWIEQFQEARGKMIRSFPRKG